MTRRTTPARYRHLRHPVTGQRVTSDMLGDVSFPDPGLATVPFVVALFNALPLSGKTYALIYASTQEANPTCAAMAGCVVPGNWAQFVGSCLYEPSDYGRAWPVETPDLTLDTTVDMPGSRATRIAQWLARLALIGMDVQGLREEITLAFQWLELHTPRAST